MYIDYLFQQVPVLEVNGKFLAQSRAIAGFLASEFGMQEQANFQYTVHAVQAYASTLFNYYSFEFWYNRARWKHYIREGTVSRNSRHSC